MLFLRHVVHRSQSRLYSTTHRGHAQWYTDILPGMIPVALLGSAVYLGLQLARSHLSHEKYLDDARARVTELESELESLRESKYKTSAEALLEPSTSQSQSKKRSSWWFV